MTNKQRNILVIAVAIFAVIIAVVAVVSASAGHDTQAAAAAATAVAAVEVTRRELAKSSAKVEAGVKDTSELGVKISDDLVKTEAEFAQAETDINAMSLEQKVALANAAKKPGAES